MDTNITSLQRIQLEARQAAARYQDVNDACPYPWLSGAAIAFKREFLAARADIEAADAFDEEPPEDLPDCTCTDQHTLEELDTNQCDACGKPIVL